MKKAPKSLPFSYTRNTKIVRLDKNDFLINGVAYRAGPKNFHSCRGVIFFDNAVLKFDNVVEEPPRLHQCRGEIEIWCSVEGTVFEKYFAKLLCWDWDGEWIVQEFVIGRSGAPSTRTYRSLKILEKALSLRDLRTDNAKNLPNGEFIIFDYGV